MSTSSTDHSAPTASEIRQLLLDPVAAERTIQEVEEPIDAVFINSLNLITRTIHRLEMEIEQQEREFELIFNYASISQSFRQHLAPILWDFRRRNPNPYPSTSTSPSLRSNHSSKESLPALFPLDDPPRTVEIHSEPTDEPAPSNLGNSTTFHTANEPAEPSGSLSNPIDVDEIPTHLIPAQLANLNSGMCRSRSNPHAFPRCRMCVRSGHTNDDCLWKGAIVCSYCMEIGHGNRNCPAIHHDMARYDSTLNFCMLCGQPGHTLVQCGSLQHSQ